MSIFVLIHIGHITCSCIWIYLYISIFIELCTHVHVQPACCPYGTGLADPCTWLRSYTRISQHAAHVVQVCLTYVHICEDVHGSASRLVYVYFWSGWPMYMLVNMYMDQLAGWYMVTLRYCQQSASMLKICIFQHWTTHVHNFDHVHGLAPVIGLIIELDAYGFVMAVTCICLCLDYVFSELIHKPDPDLISLQLSISNAWIWNLIDVCITVIICMFGCLCMKLIINGVFCKRLFAYQCAWLNVHSYVVSFEYVLWTCLKIVCVFHVHWNFTSFYKSLMRCVSGQMWTTTGRVGQEHVLL
jgi:hypothetical protein